VDTGLDGRQVVLLARIWDQKITRITPNSPDTSKAVLKTVAHPDHTETDVLAARRRFYRRDVGPEPVAARVRKLRAGAWTHHQCASQTQGSQAMDAVTVHIGALAFDYADYDPDGDVLFLHVGEPPPAEGEETPEGHVLRLHRARNRSSGRPSSAPSTAATSTTIGDTEARGARPVCEQLPGGCGGSGLSRRGGRHDRGRAWLERAVTVIT
jgi:hypothetical protein